jgi:hypothetical protein
MLSREQILGTMSSLKRKEINVPNWNGVVLIREFTGAERDSVESIMLRANKTNDFSGVRAHVVCLAVIDENGNPVFDLKKDMNIVSNLSAQALEIIFKEACILSGMTPEEGAEKNALSRLTDLPGLD